MPANNNLFFTIITSFNYLLSLLYIIMTLKSKILAFLLEIIKTCGKVYIEIDTNCINS